MLLFGFQYISACVLFEENYFKVSSMKKLLINLMLGISFLSWILFIVIGLIYIFPNSALRAINSIPSTYSFEYSNIKNNGTVLNPILTFSDIAVRKNSTLVYAAKESTVGIIYSLSLVLGKVGVNILNIQDARIIMEKEIAGTSTELPVLLHRNLSVNIKNVVIERMGETINVDGSWNGVFPRPTNGQLTIIHKEKISNISVYSDGEKSNFLVNLQTLNWLQLFSNRSFSVMKPIHFGANFIGSIHPDGSAIRGSLNYEETNYNELIVKKNKGSFFFQSRDGLATLSLNKFLHPVIDDQFPIKFDLKNNAIAISKLFISDQVIELQGPRFSNIAFNEIAVLFDANSLTYSGQITDLDLADIYFDEMLNLRGAFFGINQDIKFLLIPSTVLIKRKDSEYRSLDINGKGSFSKTGFSLETQIDEQGGSVNLQLNLPPSQKKPLNLILVGHNLSKSMILTSIPKTLDSAHHFLESSMSLGPSNDIFLDYATSTLSDDSDFNLKFYLQDTGLSINSSLSFEFERVLLEIDNDNLYISASPGSVNKFLIKDFYADFQFSKKLLKYTSVHEGLSSEIIELFESPPLFLNRISAEAASKGSYNFQSQEIYNSLTIKTESFSIPVYKEFTLMVKNGEFFIVNFDKLYGRFLSKFLDQDEIIFLKGINLLDSYELDFFSTFSFEPKKLIPHSSLFEISGKDSFVIDLEIHKNTQPSIKIFSELQEIEFHSDVPFLQEFKKLSLPTDIIISNFSNPEIYIKNNLLELKINSFKNPQGYISFGGDLPAQFNFIRNAKDLNIFIGLEKFKVENFDGWSLAQPDNQKIVLNNFIFNIAELTIFNNQFRNINGSLSTDGSNLNGKIQGKNLNGRFSKGSSAFLKLELEETHLKDISFLSFKEDASNFSALNARLIMKNSSIPKIQIKFLDVYLQKNKNIFTLNDIELRSNLMTISPLSKSANAYFSVNSKSDISKLRGNYMIKDSLDIPVIKDLANFSYFNGDINLQWKNLKRLQDIEGNLNFILKDLLVTDKKSNSMALNLLGVLNLKNILGKVANLDLTLDEFKSTKLNRVEGHLVLSKSKARLASPLFIDTNAAKMKWTGLVNKNLNGELSQLDLGLNLRVRIGENIPWYAAVLGGIPAIAGSAIIAEIFESNIDNLSNYQYEVSGSLEAPIIQRIN